MTSAELRIAIEQSPIESFEAWARIIGISSSTKSAWIRPGTVKVIPKVIEYATRFAIIEAWANEV